MWSTFIIRFHPKRIKAAALLHGMWIINHQTSAVHCFVLVQISESPPMFRQLLRMTGLSSCEDDCSGRGECYNGTCLCEIRYTGEHCDNPNLPYHAGIGGLFMLIALVCAIQLIMCIVFEYQRLKTPSFLKACKITTQKLLYFVTFLAALMRGAYFMSPVSKILFDLIAGSYRAVLKLAR